MPIIDWIHIVPEEHITQVFLRRPLTAAEAERVAALSGTTGSFIDGDHITEPSHPDFRYWVNIDTLTPELEAYLHTL